MKIYRKINNLGMNRAKLTCYKLSNTSFVFFLKCSTTLLLIVVNVVSVVTHYCYVVVAVVVVN